VDLFTGLSLTSERSTFARDQHGAETGAIGVRAESHPATHWRLPPAVYFNAEFTILAWIRVKRCNRWSPFLYCVGATSTADTFDVSVTFGEMCAVTTVSVHSGLANLMSDELHVVSRWAHLAVSVKARSIQIYVNGVRVIKDGRIKSLRGVMRDRCYFGGLPNLYYSNADFDEIKFFDRALSRAEIINDYKNVKSYTFKLLF
jgi:hypothetical protein